MYEQYIEKNFIDAIQKIDENFDLKIDFDVPKDESHGDLSTNIAMKLAKPMKKAPKQIAQDIIDNLQYDNKIIEFVNIAGPGFINIKFSTGFYSEILSKLIEEGNDLGKSDEGKGKKVNVEYVSCNPTGLLHLGHGRNASLGDSIANFYEWLGYEVTREYYFNNAGNQMNMLADSIYARYMQINDPEFRFPENGYHGEYIKDIANELKAEKKDSLIDYNEDNKTNDYNLCSLI